MILGNDHDREIESVLKNGVGLAWEESWEYPRQPTWVVAVAASGQDGEELVVQTYCNDSSFDVGEVYIVMTGFFPVMFD